MEQLKTWMTDAGETDETLAAKVNVSRVQISRIRRGLSRPSAPLAETLSQLTGIAAWDFLKPEHGSNQDAA